MDSGVAKISAIRAAILTAFLTLSAPAHSAGYTPWAKITQIERVGDGVLVFGQFGDPNSCGQSDKIYYPSTHKDYELVLSMALTALTAAPAVINQSYNGQAIYIR